VWERSQRWGVEKITAEALACCVLTAPSLQQRIKHAPTLDRLSRVDGERIGSIMHTMIDLDMVQVSRLRRVSYLFTAGSFRTGLAALRKAIRHRWAQGGLREVTVFLGNYAGLLLHTVKTKSAREHFRAVVRRLKR
jgi:hypothetical protein